MSARHLSLLLAPFAVLADAAPAHAASWLSELRGYDARAVTVGHRLVAAARPHCPRLAGTTGMALDAIDRYAPRDRAAAADELGLTAAVAVAAVAAGGPAQRAGVAPGDTLVAVAGERLAGVPSEAASEARTESARAAVAAAARRGAVALQLRRGDVLHAVTVTPEAVCAVELVVSTRGGIVPFTDGASIDVPAGLFRFAASDDEVAFALAHEIAHAVIGQRPSAGAGGRRRAELDADAIAVALMAAAGFDPAASVAFWTRFRARDTFGFLRLPGHPSIGRRIALANQVLVRMRAGRDAHGLIEEVLRARDRADQ